MYLTAANTKSIRGGARRTSQLFLLIAFILAGVLAEAAQAQPITLTGLRTHARTTDPNGKSPKDDPGGWTELAPNDDSSEFTVGSGQSIWIGVQNEEIKTRKKKITIKLKIGPSGASKKLRRPEAVGYGADGTATPGRVATRCIEPYLTIVAIFNPQPEWESIKLTNPTSGSIKVTFEKVRTTTTCTETVLSPRDASQGLWQTDLFDTSFGIEDWMVNETRITQIEIYPERCIVDAAAEPGFDADPASGEWFYEYSFVDPEGEPRPQGGVRWICTGPGLGAQELFNLNLPLIGESDTLYKVFAWDEDGGEYQDFLFKLDGYPWVETFRHYWPENGMHGQWDWQGWDDDETFDALTTDTHAYSDYLSVDIKENADLVHPFTGADSGKWVFSTMVYVPVEMFEISYFILLNTYPADISHPENWSLQIEFDGGAGVVKDFDSPNAIPLIKGEWAEVRVEIDLDADVQTTYYNGVELVTKSWTGGVEPGGEPNIAAVDLWANGATSVYYDDIVLEHGEFVPSCPADITGDGVVDVLDLLAVLSAWVDYDPDADITGDGIVDVLDLLEVLAAWGPCE